MWVGPDTKSLTSGKTYMCPALPFYTFYGRCLAIGQKLTQAMCGVFGRCCQNSPFYYMALQSGIKNCMSFLCTMAITVTCDNYQNASACLMGWYTAETKDLQFSPVQMRASRKPLSVSRYFSFSGWLLFAWLLLMEHCSIALCCWPPCPKRGLALELDGLNGDSPAFLQGIWRKSQLDEWRLLAQAGEKDLLGSDVGL